MRRREFIVFAAGAVAFAARAQRPALPVIGYLSAVGLSHVGSAFLQGLSEAGYAEGRNVVIEIRLAEGRYDRLPQFAAELDARDVSVTVAAGGSSSGLAAKAATAKIPSFFSPAAIRCGRASWPASISPAGTQPE